MEPPEHSSAEPGPSLTEPHYSSKRNSVVFGYLAVTVAAAVSLTALWGTFLIIPSVIVIALGYLDVTFLALGKPSLVTIVMRLFAQKRRD